VIRGRYVALGHWIAGKLDPSAFPADPAGHPGVRIFRTGDLVLLRPDGMLVPQGRADRQVKINGLRVEPAETEAALRSLPGVADAAVTVHGDADAPVLVAFVVPAAREPIAETAAQPTAQRVRDWRSELAALLPLQQVPVRIHLVSAIPLLPSLKPDLAALRALLSTETPPGFLARLRSRLHGGRRWRRAASARKLLQHDGATP
jgi:acyl-coenzyme A synthetase/AMP-(fatty) acid ligase